MGSSLPKIIESPVYKLIETTSGAVIIAKNSIPEPITLFIESPLVVTSIEAPLHGSDERGKDYHEVITSRVLASLESLSEEDQNVFWSLRNKLCHLPQTVKDMMDPIKLKLLDAQGIIFSNNYNFNGKRTMIYPTYAQLKHSCTPNTCILYDKETDKLAIRTIRPIQKNQEITVSRLHSVYTSRTSRQTELGLQGINCRCECCNLSEEKSKLSDERRKKLKDLFEPLKEAWMLGRCTGEAFFVEMKGIFDSLEFENLNHVECDSRGFFFTTCLEVAASHREFAVASYCAQQVAEALRIRSGIDNVESTTGRIAPHPSTHPAWKYSNHNDIPFDPQGRGQTYKLYGIEKVGNDGEIISTTATKKKTKKNKKKKKKKSKSISSTPLDELNNIQEEDEVEGEESYHTPPNELDDKASNSLTSSLTLSQSSTPDLLLSVVFQDFEESVISDNNQIQNQSQYNVASSQLESNNVEFATAETDLSTALKNVLGRISSTNNTFNFVNPNDSVSSMTPSPQVAVQSIAQKIAADVRIPSSHSSNTSLSSTSTRFEDLSNRARKGSPKLDSDKSRRKIQKAEAKRAVKKREDKIARETVGNSVMLDLKESDRVIHDVASNENELYSPKSMPISNSSSSAIEIDTSSLTTSRPAPSSTYQSETGTSILFSPGLPRSTVNSHFPLPTAPLSSEFLSARILTNQAPNNPYVGPKSWKKVPSEDSLRPRTKNVRVWNIKKPANLTETLTASVSKDSSQASDPSSQPPNPSSTAIKFSQPPTFMEQQSVITSLPPPLPISDSKLVSAGLPPTLDSTTVSIESNVVIENSKAVKTTENDSFSIAAHSTEESTSLLEEKNCGRFRKLDIAMGLAIEDEKALKEPVAKGGWNKENNLGTGKFSSSVSSSRSNSHFFPSSKNLGSNRWSSVEEYLPKKPFDSVTSFSSAHLPLPTFVLTPPTSPTSEIEYPTLPSISAYFPLPPKIPLTFDRNLNAIASLVQFHPVEVQVILKENLDRVSKYPSHLPLNTTWTLLFSDSNKDLPSHRKSDHYHLEQIKILKASTVPELCIGLKSLAIRLNSPAGPLETLKYGASLAFFREGVEPVWEDEWNRMGGRLLYFPAKGTKSLDDTFLALILLVAGGSLSHTISLQAGRLREEGRVVGIVASKRSSGNRIEIWVAGSKVGENVPSEWLKILRQVLSMELGMEGPEIFSYKKNKNYRIVISENSHIVRLRFDSYKITKEFLVVNLQPMTTQTKVFYGVIVDAFSYHVASESLASYAGSHLACDLIYKRREKGILAIRLSTSNIRAAITELPREVWELIKSCLLEEALIATGLKVNKKIYSKCVGIESLRDLGIRFTGPYEDCLIEEGGESERCHACLDLTVKYWNNFYSKAKMKNIQKLENVTGLRPVSHKFVGEAYLTDGLVAITFSQNDLPKQKDFNLDLVNHYNHKLSKLSVDEIPVPLSTVEESNINSRFKSFVKTYQLQAGPPSCYSVPIDTSNFELELRKPRAVKIVPEWIKWEVTLSNN